MNDVAVSLDTWLQRINDVYYKDVDFGLTRIRAVAKRMHLLTWDCPVIIVGGTNGKGSTTKALEAIYTEAGYTPGCFTSPHLMHYRERISIAQQYCEDAELIAAFEAIDLAREQILLTFFEYSVLAALFCFQGRGVDVVILEVGVGGELDATNIINADIAIITSIGLDHQEWLGPDRETIAVAKAGIMRPGKVFICGDPQPPQTLFDAAAAYDVNAFYIGKDFLPDTMAKNIRADNAACARQAVICLSSCLPVCDEVIDQVIASVVVSGRTESRLIAGKRVVFDVAHNVDSAEHLRSTLEVGVKRAAVFSMLKGKDIEMVVASMSNKIQTWYVAGLSISSGLHARDGMTAEQVAAYVQTSPNNVCYTFSTISNALTAALADDSVNEIVVFGSFYTVAAAMSACDSKGEDY